MAPQIKSTGRSEPASRVGFGAWRFGLQEMLAEVGRLALCRTVQAGGPWPRGLAGGDD